MSTGSDGVGDAFAPIRAMIGTMRECPKDLVKDADEMIQIGFDEGLEIWNDGPLASGHDATTDSEKRVLSSDDLKATRLWVVREDDVVHAPEDCAFGKAKSRGVVKHSNLTGGAPAFCGGEVIFVSDREIVVSGDSGRYHPRSETEMTTVAQCFKRSGYAVWSMGYDADADRPLPFVGTGARWVA